MLNKKVHMQDQVTNRIELIMQENKKPFLMHQLEEISIAMLLVAVFVVGVGF